MTTTQLTILGFVLLFLGTTLGSAVVLFVRKELSERLNTLFLGFAGGIMIAASVWSLLIPAIDSASAKWGDLSWVPAAIGFLIGGLFLVLLDRVIPHIHNHTHEEEGPKSQIHKTIKLFFAVTIHNIPEGLAVGFAFGAAAVAGDIAAYMAALGLAIGICVQNIPEGAAVALPMRNVVGSNRRAFWFGTASGVVEPLSALLGYYLSTHIIDLHPWMLAFAAGAMIFVVAEDLIPDAKISEHSHLGTWGVMAGFTVMMILDVALG